MNKDISTIKKAQGLALSKEEKRSIWSMIEKRGQELPVTSPFRDSEDISRRSVVPSSYFLFFQRKLVAGMAALCIVISGGVSAIAEGALPGESLYAVKVNVNEKMQSLLAFTDESKASVEAALAVRRLEEVKVLAKSGNLSLQVEENAKTRFAKHSQTLEQHLEKLNAKGDGDAVVAIGGKYENGVVSAYETFVGVRENDNQVDTAGFLQMMVAPMAASSVMMYDASVTEAATKTGVTEDTSVEAESVAVAKSRAKQSENKERELVEFAEEIRKISSKTSLLRQESEERLRVDFEGGKRSRNRE